MTSDLFPEVKPDVTIDPDARFTTRRALAWVMKTARVDEFDLDVAACTLSRKATSFYSRAENGLERIWWGRVFCNPPWSDIGPWVERAWDVITSTKREQVPVICMLLPGDRTHRPWWQMLVEPSRDLGATSRLRVHFPPERFAYGNIGNPEGIGVPEPNFTSCLLVFR